MIPMEKLHYWCLGMYIMVLQPASDMLVWKRDNILEDPVTP